MFENLSNKLQEVFKKLSGKGRLSEADVDAALREVRLALLEADVNFRVVKDFITRVRERAIGADVMKSLSPAQMVIKIVHQELIATLGEARQLNLSGNPPHIIMLAGLQGSGKTTMAAKLAQRLRQSGQRPLLVAADTRRPAAITQLEVLGRQLDITVHSEGDQVPPPRICANAVEHARKSGYSVVLLDTAGRLHIDDEMMHELEEVVRLTKPQEVLLVVDAMTGQDAVRVAEEFNRRVPLTGLILTKIDGDARGGAALSIRSVTGVPILFLGTGEKTDAVESFQPDRLASRILGMGDMLTLIEKAEAAFDQEQAQKMELKLRTATFDLEDFLEQMQQLKKMGPLQQILEMVPGLASLKGQVTEDLTEKQMKRSEAIIRSMTPAERRDPRIIDGSRKRRIARGSGASVVEINQLLNQFRQMQRMMKQVSTGRGASGLLGRFGL
ncbi:MAG TPA: signal recognition particle protein [Anaerolineae bacterium]|nr:signal recognition particle protein [Anaerolineae bacterium]HNT04999.1 signal recognition particle protein [Anaerolineae bacterium]